MEEDTIDIHSNHFQLKVDDFEVQTQGILYLIAIYIIFAIKEGNQIKGNQRRERIAEGER